MKTENLNKVVKEILKLNNGSCGHFDYDQTYYNISKHKEAYQNMKWIVDEFLPTKDQCQLSGINRKVIMDYYKQLQP